MIDHEAAQRFARAALVGLVALDRRERVGRRFGADADARWESFRGHLHLGDRIELLLRDGAVTWGSAFSPSRAWRMAGVSADDPFGPGWPGFDASAGRRLWQEALELPEMTAPEAFARASEALGVREPDCIPPGDLTPAMRVLVVGDGALEVLVRLFAEQGNLRWASQVVVAASTPERRQLAGLAAVLLDAPQTPPPIAGGPDADVADQLRAAGLAGIDRIVASGSAHPQDRAFADRVRERFGL